MTDITRKICLIGEFGVGKTSLVARFVRGIFSERYLTTVGVKVDTKIVALAGRGNVKLVIWDIAGKTTLDSVTQPYLQGASALLLVADGTRLRTVDTACELLVQARGVLADPAVALLINKVDVLDDWEVGSARIDELRQSMAVFTTSALTGIGVEDAFRHIATEVAR